MKIIPFRMDGQQAPVYITRNYIQNPGINHMEKNMKKDVYLHV